MDICGYAVYNLFPLSKVFYTDSLFVDDAIRQAGVGNALLSTAMVRIQAGKISVILLLTKAQSAAEAFYRKRGFTQLGNRLRIRGKILMSSASNHVGEGLWTITGFRQNELLEFLVYQDDLLTFSRLNVVDNGDSTITATWNTTFTALSETGNQKIDAMPGAEIRSHQLSAMINHYLTTGETLVLPEGLDH